MRKQWLAIAVMLIGIMGFIVMQAGQQVQAFSPYLAAQPLRGHIIGIDAGHGGYDGGCEGSSGVQEKELNLAVARLLKAELEAQGAIVVMSREEDIALIDPEKTTGYKKRKELDNRLKIFEEAGIEMMVSIHMNKYSDASQRGAQVFYSQGQEMGRTLALTIQNALHDLDPEYVRMSSTGEYYILNASSASVLVECGFLSNKAEEELLKTEDYQKKLAKSIADGIIQYINNAAVQ